MTCTRCKRPIYGPRQIANGQDTGHCRKCVEQIEDELRRAAHAPAPPLEESSS